MSSSRKKEHRKGRGMRVNPAYASTVTGILVPRKILVRGPKFSAIFPENLGPGPFFSNIVLKILAPSEIFALAGSKYVY